MKAKIVKIIGESEDELNIKDINYSCRNFRLSKSKSSIKITIVTNF